VAEASDLKRVRSLLRELGDPVRAEHSKRFFKTGPGEYGEGDVFLGLKVPDIRRLSRAFRGLALAELRKLLRSKIHEERLLALFVLVLQFEKGDERVRTAVYGFYLKSARFVNNWDLVDASADHIVGGYLEDKDRDILLTLAESSRLWERRISIIATYHFIKQDDFAWTLKVAERLVADSEDLIHKAVGWMLREVGNRDRKVEEGFLREHYRLMPRTMLRYAIERFPERRRQRYLKGTI
jgi:3-methyladenine DNA glycosylase AlkD